jgi:hypothetical protein
MRKSCWARMEPVTGVDLLKVRNLEAIGNDKVIAATESYGKFAAAKP